MLLLQVSSFKTYSIDVVQEGNLSMGISLLHQYCMQLMYLQPLKITVSFHQHICPITPLSILHPPPSILLPTEPYKPWSFSLSHCLIHYYLAIGLVYGDYNEQPTVVGHRLSVWRLPVGTMSNQQLWFYLAIGFQYGDDQLVQSGPEHCLPGGRGPHERQTGSSWTTACGEGGRGGRGGRWRE